MPKSIIYRHNKFEVDREKERKTLKRMGERLRKQAEDSPQISGVRLVLLHLDLLGNGGPKVVQNFTIYTFLQTEDLMLLGCGILLFSVA